MEGESRNKGFEKSRYAIIPFRVKFILACYLLLVMLMIIAFMMLMLGLFTVMEIIVLTPIILFGLFSCAYDLLDYREELLRLQEYIIKRMLRIGRRFSRWKDGL